MMLNAGEIVLKEMPDGKLIPRRFVRALADGVFLGRELDDMPFELFFGSLYRVVEVAVNDRPLDISQVGRDNLASVS